MPTKQLTTIEKIEKNLFRTEEDAVITLTEAEGIILKRYQDAYVYWHDHPDLTDSQIIEYLKTQFDVSKSQAYRDLYNIKHLLGNVRANQKEWLRYTVLTMCKEAYQKAAAKGDVIGMVMAADKLGKYGRVDQEDADGIDWNNLPGTDFEPTGDVSVLDPKLLESDFEKKRTALRRKFSGDVQDVEFEEVKE